MHYPNYDKRYYQSVQDVLGIKFRMISVKKLNKNYTAVTKEKHSLFPIGMLLVLPESTHNHAAIQLTYTLTVYAKCRNLRETVKSYVAFCTFCHI